MNWQDKMAQHKRAMRRQAQLKNLTLVLGGVALGVALALVVAHSIRHTVSIFNKYDECNQHYTCTIDYNDRVMVQSWNGGEGVVTEY